MMPAPPDPAFWLSLGAILILLAVAALFAAARTAVEAASRTRLRALADQGHRGAIRALALKDDAGLTGSLLLGRMLVIVLAVALATGLADRHIGRGSVAVAVAALGMTVAVLVLAELLPKTWAIANPEGVALRLAGPAGLASRGLAPLFVLLRTMARGLLWLFGRSASDDGAALALREEIAGAIELGHSGGAMPKEDRDRLMGALDLADRTVDEVMRHRSRIEMVDAGRPPGAIISQVLASPHTRLPVYRGSDDNILGVIHAKDLLREVDRLTRGAGAAEGEDPLAALDVVKVAMKPYFVPETTSLDEQMRQFLKRRTHFALVVDEYGALQGLITLEDILEEIVGEIVDEFDRPEAAPVLARGEKGEVEVPGSATIRDLNRLLDWKLPDGEANTVAGLVIHEAQTIPQPGQVFRFHGFRFEVMARENQRITRLRILPPDATENAARP